MASIPHIPANDTSAPPVRASQPRTHTTLRVATQQTAASEALARDLTLPEPIARILLHRGLTTRAAVDAFLHPQLSHLHNPFLMLGMGPAVARLRSAVAAREPILIYGDYDVDGTVATVLLKTALERAAASLGVPADVRYHIPHRIREGYGMRESRIEDAAREGVRLVVSVDTGIRAHAAAEEAARLGLDLIVTDHHLPDEANGTPRALAVLNPNQPGCTYPCKDLCGAGVAFKLAQALLESAARDESERQRLREKTLPSFLKLLAIATIADSVPLTGENRVIASLGLQELRRPAQPGLRRLLELAQIDTTRPISSTDVGFRLAPRINAAGRMDIAGDVVDLFLARDPALAHPLAEKLHRLNDERRATEASALREIEQQIEALLANPEGLPACLVLDDASISYPNVPGDSGSTENPGAPSSPTALSSAKVGSHDAQATRWHRGVVGILASRVVDRTGRPALVLSNEETTDQDGKKISTAHGSGRSIPGFHLLDALTAVHNETAPLFARFGGHAHAVGFALPSDRVATLRERLAAYAATRLTADSLTETLDCDAELRLAEITPDLFAAHHQLGPFGLGNHEPLFLTRDARLLSLRAIKDKHLRLTVEDPAAGARFSGMAWARRTNWAARAAENGWSPGDRFDLAFRLREDHHPDFGSRWEMEIVHLERLSGTANLAAHI